jgi:hypothetical protein
MDSSSCCPTECFFFSVRQSYPFFWPTWLCIYSLFLGPFFFQKCTFCSGVDQPPFRRYFTSFSFLGEREGFYNSSSWLPFDTKTSPFSDVSMDARVPPLLQKRRMCPTFPHLKHFRISLALPLPTAVVKASSSIGSPPCPYIALGCVFSACPFWPVCHSSLRTSSLLNNVVIRLRYVGRSSLFIFSSINIEFASIILSWSLECSPRNTSALAAYIST